MNACTYHMLVLCLMFLYPEQMLPTVAPEGLFSNNCSQKRELKAFVLLCVYLRNVIIFH